MKNGDRARDDAGVEHEIVDVLEPWERRYVVRSNGVETVVSEVDLFDLGFLAPSAPEPFIRASGDCLCASCGREYRRHPQDKIELSYDGHPFLRILCDGTRVKL
jgi:hypothetical protein